MKFNHLYMEIS